MFAQKESWWGDSSYVSLRLKNSDLIWRSISSAAEGKRFYTSQDYITHYHVNQLVLSRFRQIPFSVSSLARMSVIHSLIFKIWELWGWAGYIHWIYNFRNHHHSVGTYESHFHQAPGLGETAFHSSIQHDKWCSNRIESTVLAYSVKSGYTLSMFSLHILFPEVSSNILYVIKTQFCGSCYNFQAWHTANLPQLWSAFQALQWTHCSKERGLEGRRMRRTKRVHIYRSAYNGTPQ